MVSHHPTDWPRGFGRVKTEAQPAAADPVPMAWMDGSPCHGRPGPVVFPTNIKPRVAGPPPHEPECALGGFW